MSIHSIGVFVVRACGLGLVAWASFAQGSEVLEIGESTPLVLRVSQDRDETFIEGDKACLDIGSRYAICGTITEAHSDSALLKIESPNDSSRIRIGQRVKYYEPEGVQRKGRESSSHMSPLIALSAEMGGAGLHYTFLASIRFSPEVAINAGWSMFNVAIGEVGEEKLKSRWQFYPFSFSLFTGKDHILEMIAGLVMAKGSGEIVLSNGDEEESKTAFLIQAGAGYRYWPVGGGLHFRVTTYVFQMPSSVKLGDYPKLLFWGGLGIGYAF